MRGTCGLRNDERLAWVGVPKSGNWARSPGVGVLVLDFYEVRFDFSIRADDDPALFGIYRVTVDECWKRQNFRIAGLVRDGNRNYCDFRN